MEKKRILLEQISAEEFSEFTANRVIEKLKQHLPHPEKPKYISRKEAAKQLGISLVTLHKWTRNGILPSHRIASRIMYKPEEVDMAVKKRNIGKDIS